MECFAAFFIHADIVTTFVQNRVNWGIRPQVEPVTDQVRLFVAPVAAGNILVIFRDLYFELISRKQGRNFIPVDIAITPPAQS